MPWKVTYRGFCTHSVDVGSSPTGHDVVRRNTKFARPEKMLIFVEGVNWPQEKGVYVRDSMCPTDVSSILATGKRHKIYLPWLRHLGTTNVGFLDGHVERMDPVSMATLSMTWQEQMVPSSRIDGVQDVFRLSSLDDRSLWPSMPH